MFVFADKSNGTIPVPVHKSSVFLDLVSFAKSDNKIRLDNMYEIYNIRPELLKSRQFYNNAFDTSVNYEDLMALKKELMR